MAVVPIIQAPHLVLRQKAALVVELDKKIMSYAQNLADTLRAARNPVGVGLAAPQIAKKWQIFATQLEHSTTGQLQIKLFFNPRLVDQSDRLVTGVNPRQPDLEGCLSIPLFYAPVARPEWVTLTWQELTPDHQLSTWHTETFFDFSGRVIQHELDHLQGILFTDHVQEQSQPLYRTQGDDLVACSDYTPIMPLNLAPKNDHA